MRKAIFGLTVFLLLVGAKCNNCDQLLAAKLAACASGDAVLCKSANEAYDKGCAVQPTPTPTPTPTPEPTPVPTPPTVPGCAVVLCSPGRHCVEGSGCVADPSALHPTPYEGNYVVKTKKYGQGLDATLTVQGDCDYCASVGLGQIDGQIRCGCPLFGDGHPLREAKELATMGGCPTWQWRTATYPEWSQCIQIDGHPDGGMSCDHFGNAVIRDDPNTGPFEGEPAVCGKQVDDDGNPKAGFFTIAHGDGWVRACDASGKHCGNETRVQY